MAHRSVAVFGSSEARQGEALYEEARRLGSLLAAAGYRVVTGGYGGVMEGASRGAREAGGRTLGVTSSIFRERRPNPYLSEVVETGSLTERTRVLVETSDAYLILHGKSGTLQELTLVWALHRAGSLPARPVILLGAAWGRLLGHLVAEEMLAEVELRITRVVASPEEALHVLEALCCRADKE